MFEVPLPKPSLVVIRDQSTTALFNRVISMYPQTRLNQSDQLTELPLYKLRMKEEGETRLSISHLPLQTLRATSKVGPYCTAQ